MRFPIVSLSLLLGAVVLSEHAQASQGAADPNRTVQGSGRNDYHESLRSLADPAIPPYQRGAEATGTLTIMGTDTMVNLMNIWMTGFCHLQPKIAFHLEAKGSLTGAPPLIEGRSDLATFSREMFPSEVEAFRAKYGYAPLAIRVALGGWRAPDRTGISVFFVHRDNPITRLTMEQLSAIYGTVPGRPPITVWGQLGLTGKWAEREIHPVGIAMPDGTANFIRHFVCEDTDFTSRLVGEKTGLPVKASVRILADIAHDPGAIGYVSLLYENPATKPIAIARTADGPDYHGSFDETASAQYPLTRFVYLYVNRTPGKKIEPKIEEFLHYVLSLEGQQGVQAEGLFLPLPTALVATERAKLD